jgi:NTE family protein
MRPSRGLPLPAPALAASLAALAATLLAAGCGSARRELPSLPVPPPSPTVEVAPRVGLALGGGGARGFAEVGVLRVLAEERIPVAVVAGTSVGAVIGALYADRPDVFALEYEALAIQERDLLDRSLLSLISGGGYAKGERIEAYLGTRLAHAAIEDMPLRFAAVATDLTSGATVSFERGPVARAVRASAAIPGIFAPVEIDGRLYVDGGVSNPVPADVVRRLGAEVVIAVSIPREIPKEPPRTQVGVAMQSIAIMAAEISRCREREADVVVTPQVGDVAFDDFSQKRRLIEAGIAATRAALPEIRRAIAARTKRVPQ